MRDRRFATSMSCFRSMTCPFRSRICCCAASFCLVSATIWWRSSACSCLASSLSLARSFSSSVRFLLASRRALACASLSPRSWCIPLSFWSSASSLSFSLASCATLTLWASASLLASSRSLITTSKSSGLGPGPTPPASLADLRNWALSSETCRRRSSNSTLLLLLLLLAADPLPALCKSARRRRMVAWRACAGGSST